MLDRAWIEVVERREGPTEKFSPVKYAKASLNGKLSRAMVLLVAYESGEGHAAKPDCVIIL